MNAPFRPALRYHGGKWRLAPWIISHFPAHRIYVEPFGGGASVLLRKPALPAECYNDLDGTVVNVFRVLRDPATALELKRRLELTLFARAEFDWSYEPFSDAVDRAHKTIVRSFMGHGSDSVTRSCRTGFRAKMTDARSLPSASWSSYAEAIPHFTLRLMNVCVEQRDALEIIDRYDDEGALFYCDPPYMHALRSSLAGRSRKTHGYAHELDDGAHLTLIERLRAVKGIVVLSGYPTSVYDDALADWTRVECAAMADGAAARTEVLWLNPAAGGGHRQRGLFDAPRLVDREVA